MGQIFSLTDKEAWEIMAAAKQTLETQFSAASVCLVNRDGTVVLFMQMDGVRPYTAKVAEHKAKQAALTGKSTQVIWSEVKEGKKTAALLGIIPGELVPWAGGLPIYDQEGNLLGAIGVSNLAEEDDAAVAENAVAKAGFKVKP